MTIREKIGESLAKHIMPEKDLGLLVEIYPHILERIEKEILELIDCEKENYLDGFIEWRKGKLLKMKLTKAELACVHGDNAREAEEYKNVCSWRQC